MAASVPLAQIGAMPSDLKHINRRLVLEAFRDGGDHSAGDIAALTGISRQTVTKALQYFESRGILSSAGKGSSTEIGGKKPELYAFSYPRLLVSVTMWPDALNLTLMDMRGKVLDSLRYSVSLPHDVGEAFEYVGIRIDELLRCNRVDKQDIYGAALSTAGTVDYALNRIKYSSITPQWGVDVPVEEYLRPHFGEDTVLFVENAGKMTGRAIQLDSALNDKRVLSLFTTWGFSACFIYNGHVLSGTNSLIGEVGHMAVDPLDDELCGCGSRGCLERLTSLDRLRRIVAEKAAEYPDSGLIAIKPELIRLDDVFRLSERGDRLAMYASDYLARLTALALRNISLCFDPDTVVFQGDYARAGEYFDQKLKENLSSFQYFPASGAFDIRYDRRPLFELDVLGACSTLQNMFFDNAAIYGE